MSLFVLHARSANIAGRIKQVNKRSSLKLKRRSLKIFDAVIAIIKKDNKYFIQKRPSKGLLADLWEFPGGKIKAGESNKKALIRELNEELGVKLSIFKTFIRC